MKTALCAGMSIIFAVVGRVPSVALAASSSADPFADLEKRFTEAGKTVEDFLRIPYLTIDIRKRDVQLEILHAQTAGGISIDMESRSHMGHLPTARFILAGPSALATLRAETSHDLRRLTVGCSWKVGAAVLTAAVDRAGRAESGLSWRLTEEQSLDYSMRTGPLADHRIGWSLRLKL